MVSFLLLLISEAHVVWTTLDLRVRFGVIPEIKIHGEIFSQAHLLGFSEVSFSTSFFSRDCILT
jgi:hypothetical protein